MNKSHPGHSFQRVEQPQGGLCLILLVVLLVSCAPPTENGQESARQITIAQAGDFFLYAPLYVALDGGFFREENLDVRLTSTGGDEKTWAAVLSGSASFGVADPTFVAVSAQRGQPGKVVASIVNGVPFWGISFDEAIAPIQSPNELEGLTVATFPSPSTAYALQRRMFQLADLQPTIREGAFGTLLAMLKANQADIALELEPNVSQAVAQGAHVVYSLADVYGDFAITGLTTSDVLIKHDAELVASVVCALQRSLDFLRAQPARSLVILTERFPEISKEVAGAALERVLSGGIIPQTVRVNEQAWKKAVELRVEIGDLTEVGSYSTFVDPSFSKAAVDSCRLSVKEGQE